MGEAAGCGRSRMHAAGDMSAAHVAATETAAVASAKAGVPPGAAGMSAATVTSAMLRPQGNGQEQGERRNGHQTPHIELLYSWVARNLAKTAFQDRGLL